MAKYRIVTDEYLGFEVQVRRWWWPFWVGAGINTHASVEGAERYARGRAGLVVKNLGDLR